MKENSLGDILFLDIETVSGKAKFGDLSEEFQALWTDKTKFQRKDEVSAEEFYKERGGIMAEFSKIVCISVAFIYQSEDGLALKTKSFFNDDEQVLLSEFAELLSHSYSKPWSRLCAHNGKEFDFPVLARRYLINKMELPLCLQLAGKKPWDIPHIDTMELWKFGDYKHYTSLKLLCAIFGIPSPKDDIDGSMVSSTYWIENDLPRIVKYCEKDTVSLAQVYLSMQGKDLIPQEQIYFSNL
jgi:uncharacterized protein YprB with RNaseH-like and TPR domain